MFELILKEAKRSGYDGLLKAGIVHRGSLLPHQGGGRRWLRMPVRLGQPERVTGKSEALKTRPAPAWACSSWG